MHLGDGAELLAPLERLVQLGVVQLPEVLVGHEHLERVDSVLRAQLLHLGLHFRRPPGDGHVKSIIAGHLLVGTFAPLIERLDQRLSLARYDKVNCKTKTTKNTSVPAFLKSCLTFQRFRLCRNLNTLKTTFTRGLRFIDRFK